MTALLVLGLFWAYLLQICPKNYPKNKEMATFYPET